MVSLSDLADIQQGFQKGVDRVIQKEEQTRQLEILGQQKLQNDLALQRSSQQIQLFEEQKRVRNKNLSAMNTALEKLNSRMSNKKQRELFELRPDVMSHMIFGDFVNAGGQTTLTPQDLFNLTLKGTLDQQRLQLQKQRFGPGGPRNEAERLRLLNQSLTAQKKIQEFIPSENDINTLFSGAMNIPEFQFETAPLSRSQSTALNLTKEVATRLGAAQRNKPKTIDILRKTLSEVRKTNSLQPLNDLNQQILTGKFGRIPNVQEALEADESIVGRKTTPAQKPQQQGQPQNIFSQQQQALGQGIDFKGEFMQRRNTGRSPDRTNKRQRGGGRSQDFAPRRP